MGSHEGFPQISMLIIKSLCAKELLMRMGLRDEPKSHSPNKIILQAYGLWAQEAYLKLFIVSISLWANDSFIFSRIVLCSWNTEGPRQNKPSDILIILHPHTSFLLKVIFVIVASVADSCCRFYPSDIGLLNLALILVVLPLLNLLSQHLYFRFQIHATHCAIIGFSST